ncbi:hypothetical protein MBRA_25180 [Mycobacterium branderi]|uniref:Uncharacterized protein n=1 Tax=Mycobacterium branderi TaxID=43348 RepID=A0ABM7KMG6_9MYCO|nr:hypothetical protein MBRA_25180 [Mycobacterium branderi]
MAGGGTNGRRGPILRYTFGGALCLLAGINLLIGSPWYLCLAIAAVAGIIILGHGRIFRAGVSRTTDEWCAATFPGTRETHTQQVCYSRCWELVLWRWDTLPAIPRGFGSSVFFSWE